MLMNYIYPYTKFMLGTLYPTYKTWKALKRKDETTRRRWMKYWVSFGAFQMFELVADITLAYILPFYNELKLATIVWLVMGTKLIFDTIINRELTKREKMIDRWLTKINKVRDEIIALVWFEISRSTINILRSLVTVVLVPQQAKMAEEEESVRDEQQLESAMDSEEHEVKEEQVQVKPIDRIMIHTRKLRSSNQLQEQYLFVEDRLEATSSSCLQRMDDDQVLLE